MRDLITLECTVCKHRNYAGDKSKRRHPERVERKKFCPNCNKRTAHKETK